MPARDELLRLADACENASGPDRELDAEIAALCFNAEVQLLVIGPDYRREELCTIDRSGVAPVSRPVSHFTASINAALTLVPEGHVWSLFSGGWAGVAPYEDDETIADAALCGATPALALCAAALRARAASPEQE